MKDILIDIKKVIVIYIIVSVLTLSSIMFLLNCLWDKAEHKIKKDGLKHIVNTVWNGSNNK